MREGPQRLTGRCLGVAWAVDLPRPNFRICDLHPSASFPTSWQLIFHFRFQIILPRKDLVPVFYFLIDFEPTIESSLTRRYF
jgi:hypothetical protein